MNGKVHMVIFWEYPSTSPLALIWLGFCGDKLKIKEMAKVKPKPKKGSYLLSEPFLHDKNFQRAVVLITEHNEHGSIGFVLNKPIAFRLNEVVEDYMM